MPRFLIMSLALGIAVCGVTPASTQTGSPKLPIQLGKPAVAPDGFASARFTGPSDNFLQEHLRLAGESAFSETNLHAYSERFLGLERYQATDLDLVLEGAGAAATIGLFTGAVANTAGLWSEDTSWYITGAAAALGAFLGYTQAADNPAKRTRYRWSINASPSNN